MRPRNPDSTVRQTGRRVGELRRKWQLTQERFAERARISVDYVQTIEHGRANLTLHSLTRVANALQVQVDELTKIPIRREPWPEGRPRGRAKEFGRAPRRGFRPRNPESTISQTGCRAGVLRRERGFTQERFAKRAELSVEYVRALELGHANLTLRTLTRVANALQVQVSELTRIPERSELEIATRPSKKKGSRLRRRKDHPSLFRGVSWSASRERWRVSIAHKRKRWFLGYFEKERDAARAYDAKAKKLKGDKAKLNFP